ncbi:sigma-54-dependent Fis family transcriptional regulator [Amaricoccus macauensis]|uniref:sigma-54-dependent Fis family transcriptional regulator n=1 Tax=Amaricoccus macauensis TaxID=57001 RepID=UPI003C7B6BF6
MVGLIDITEYKRAVEESRLRCQEHMLHPDTRNPIMRLQQSEVAPRREAFLDAIGDIRNETDALAEIALKAGHCLIITDPECIAIDIRTTRADQDLLEAAGIVPGSCWSEQLAGTNGVSLAVENDTVFTVRGQDHFFRNLRDVVCSGAPLRGADGEILGALSLSCLDRESPVDYVLAQHLLNQTADRIEARLFARTYATRHVMAPAPGAPRGALLALDESSTVVAATRAANAMVEGGNLIGRTLGELFETELPVVDLPGRVVRGRPVSGRLASDLREIAGRDPSMNRAVAEAERLLALNLPVLIEGGPGTGKKQLAEALLRQSRNSMRYLDGVVMAAAEEPLRAVLEWVRETDRFLGRGTEITLLLNQLDALSAQAQGLLATWLARHDECGSLQGPSARFRVVGTSSTGADLGALASVFAAHRVQLPALRKRQDLTDQIRAAHQRFAGAEATISDEALDCLLAYDWPGNLRELENVFAGIATLHGRRDLCISQLPQHIAAALAPEKTAIPDLESALRQTRWNVSRAARLMGISRATINRRIRESGLLRPAVGSE